MFEFDFKKCITDIKQVTISPKGWNGPIVIEYGLAQVNQFDTHTSVVWRVMGTTHTFHIYEPQINKYSHSNYAKHFTEILENFREDYLSWWKDPKYDGCEWREGYLRQYGKLISKNTDNRS